MVDEESIIGGGGRIPRREGEGERGPGGGEERKIIPRQEGGGERERIPEGGGE
jgi:hypothetical protein